MPLFKRKPVMQRVLELTQRYQKNYPSFEEQLAKNIPGRINLDKRFQYHSALTKLLIKNRTLRRCVTSRQLNANQKKKIIADYALKKAKGNREKAITFLTQQIQWLKSLQIDKKVLEAEARKKGFKGEDIEVYAVQTDHMYTVLILGVIRVLFEMAKSELAAS